MDGVATEEPSAPEPGVTVHPVMVSNVAEVRPALLKAYSPMYPILEWIMMEVRLVQSPKVEALIIVTPVGIFIDLRLEHI